MCRTELEKVVKDNLDQNLIELDLGKNYEDTCNYIDTEELETLNCTPNDLTICFLNIRGLCSKQSDVTKLLTESIKRKQIDVLLLAETWLTPNNKQNIKIAGYKFHGINRPHRKGGGTGILISDQLRFKLRNDLETKSDVMENSVVELETKHRNIILCSMYRPPNTNEVEFLKQYNDFTQKLITEKKKDCIIGLDHNLDLLKAEKHKSTQHFIEITLDNKLIPFITKPTRITRSTATLIDNILLSENLIGRHVCGIVCTDLSDHLPCIVSLHSINNQKREPLEIVGRNLKDPKIKEINSQLTEMTWHDVLGQSNASDKFECFHNKVMDVINEVSPERTICIPYRKIIREPWMTPGLKKCSKKQQLLYKTFLSTKTDDAEKRYKTYRQVLQKTKRASKKAHYLGKCEDFRSNTKKLWQLINNVCSKQNDKTNCIDRLRVGNIEHNNLEKITNEFARYFSTVGDSFASKVGTSHTSVQNYIKKIPRSPKSLFLTPCTPIEIDTIIRKLPNKSSSGYDGVSNVLLKKISPSIVNILTELYNESIEQGVFPTVMKYAEVVPLYKGGTSIDSSNYRPISLLITLSKVLEKLIYKRTYNFLDSTGQLYNSQYGFRSKHSCENAVMELISEIVKNQSKNKHTLAIFLDLSKAFDTLQHSVLFSKLDQYGIRGNSLDWFKSYLTNRSLRVKCVTSSTGRMEKSEDFPVKVGTPQGSCLGPLLFLIFVNDLHLHLDLCSSILFADDTTIYKSHRNLKFLKWCIEEDLKIVSDWLRANKLTLNLKKSVYILFPKSNKEVSLTIEMDGKNLKQVQQTKFLGLWIDHKLKWETHYSKLCIKLKQSIGMIRKGKNFLDRQSLKILYFAQFHSHLNYGLNCWGCMLNNSQIDKLQKLQNECINLIAKTKPMSTDVYTSLSILNIRDLISLEHCKLMFKAKHCLLPCKITTAILTDHEGKTLKKLHRYNTRHKSLPNIPKNACTNYLKSSLCNCTRKFATLSLETQQIPVLSKFISACKSEINAM